MEIGGNEAISRNRGIENIVAACVAAKAPKPRFRYEETGLWVEFPYRRSEKPSVKPSVKSSVKSSGETTQNTTQENRETTQETQETTQETREGAREKTPVETPVEILRLLSTRPDMTLAGVAERIGKSLSAVERASAKLVKEGRLQHIGPRKGGRWEVLEDSND